MFCCTGESISRATKIKPCSDVQWAVEDNVATRLVRIPVRTYLAYVNQSKRLSLIEFHGVLSMPTSVRTELQEVWMVWGRQMEREE